MNVREAIQLARAALRRRLSIEPHAAAPVCAPECGPHWRGGFCDDDCPNAPGIARHAAERFRDDPTVYMLRDGPPIRITSLEQYRELFGRGSPGESWARAHLDDARPTPPLREELSEEQRTTIEELTRPTQGLPWDDSNATPLADIEALADTIRTDGAEADLGVDHGPGWRPEDEEWEPPGEAEGLPPWVENQIPEPCPECGLSQLGALTIRRADPMLPAGNVELDSYGRITRIHLIESNYPGVRLVKAMQDHAGRWPLQRGSETSG